MNSLFSIVLIVFTLCGQTPESSKPGYVGPIVCFSDSATGEKLAENAANYLLAQGMEKHISKCFVAGGLDDEDFNRLLILVMTANGEKSFESAPVPFDKALLELLDKMKRHFGDTRVSVILQRPDKSNVREAYYDEGVSPKTRELDKAPPPETPGPASPPPPIDSLRDSPLLDSLLPTP